MNDIDQLAETIMRDAIKSRNVEDVQTINQRDRFEQITKDFDKPLRRLTDE